jgi:hypothetical protein
MVDTAVLNEIAPIASEQGLERTDRRRHRWQNPQQAPLL